MRAIGIDVHRDFCEVAISEGGQLRSAGRVPSTPGDLELLATSLCPDDEVALETTGNALAIARIIAPHVVTRGGGQRPRAARHLRRQGQDRPPRCPHPGQAAGGRHAAGHLAARRRDPCPASPARVPGAARTPAWASQERDPRHALSQPQGRRAGERSLRRRRPTLA